MIVIKTHNNKTKIEINYDSSITCLVSDDTNIDIIYKNYPSLLLLDKIICAYYNKCAQRKYDYSATVESLLLQFVFNDCNDTHTSRLAIVIENGKEVLKGVEFYRGKPLRVDTSTYEPAFIKCGAENYKLACSIYKELK